jgi:transcriptional regulator with XRE-family HTH domain
MNPKFIEIDPQELRAARHRKALTLRELGKQVGMDHNLIWMYEDGRRNPIPRNLRRLAEALGVEPADLIRGS